MQPDERGRRTSPFSVHFADLAAIRTSLRELDARRQANGASGPTLWEQRVERDLAAQGLQLELGHGRD